MLQLVMGNSSSYIAISIYSMASWGKFSGSKPGAQKQRWGPADADGNAMKAGNMPKASCESQADARFMSTDREVDIMLKVFQDMNTSMERTGEFGSTGAAGGSKAELLRMVASNNVMRTGILSSKIGLTKRQGLLCWIPTYWIIVQHFVMPIYMRIGMCARSMTSHIFGETQALFLHGTVNCHKTEAPFRALACMTRPASFGAFVEDCAC